MRFTRYSCTFFVVDVTFDVTFDAVRLSDLVVVTQNVFFTFSTEMTRYNWKEESILKIPKTEVEISMALTWTRGEKRASDRETF